MNEVQLADDVRSQAKLTDLLIGGGLALSTAGTILWFQQADAEPQTDSSETSLKGHHWDTTGAWSPQK